MAALPKVVPPHDLTIPDEGSTTMRSILSAYLRLQYQTLLRIPFSRMIPADPTNGQNFVTRIRGLAKSDPGLLFMLLRRPTIGGLIQFIASGAGSPQERLAWAAELASALCFELGLQGIPGSPVRIAPAPKQLLSMLEYVGLTIPEGVQEITFDGHFVQWSLNGQETQIDLREREGDQWQTAYYSIQGDVVLSIIDNNPHAHVEAHPDKPGNHVDLGGKSHEAWVESLQTAFGIVRETVPEISDEIELLIHQVVPVGYYDERHMSASFQEVIGTIYMSLHSDTMTMAEAIIHEFSHNKINMLCTLSPVLENAFYPLYSSPVRPDPRPLHGVLLAAHAFLPVERMYERMADVNHPLIANPRSDRRRRQIRKINHEGVETVLTHGQPTAMGTELLGELGKWDVYFGEMFGD